MNSALTASNRPLIALGCGGTGGHLFPGLAIADALQRRGCDLALMVSAKEVDQEGVKSALGMDVVTLPAIALQNQNLPGFLPAFWKSYRVCLRSFKRRRPQAVLAMGGFTSAPPVLAGRAMGAATFLHEANSIPGRANRWLSPLVNEAFVGFPSAANRLHTHAVRVTGTPVREQFRPAEAAACRISLGLDPARPVLLVMGGSQGAVAINHLAAQTLPHLLARMPALQILHLTGAKDIETVRTRYQEIRIRAVVLPFLTEMELALGAASVAISRAGASALAEIAALRVPSILFPYPAAMDNHQYYNARALMQSGAARQLDQASATPENLARLVQELAENETVRRAMREALAKWHFPNAAADIAEFILKAIGIEPLPVPDGDPEEELAPFLPPGGSAIPSNLSSWKRR